MKYEPFIVEEWEKCDAEKVLLIDDAYDPPSFSDELAGPLLELLQDARRSRYVSNALLDPATAETAIDDLAGSEYDTDAVQNAYRAVYRAYVGGRNPKVDLDDYFKDRKEAALEKLDGIVALLSKCEELQVEVAGNDTAEETFRTFHPHVLFMDYYLSLSDRQEKNPSQTTKNSDEMRSIKLVGKLLEKARGSGPSVILMSSEDIDDRGGSYRADLEGAVLALRFGFLHKDGVSIEGKALSIDGRAADILLDTAQGFGFGKDIQLALSKWREGAEKALDDLQDELRDLDVRDFAYLLRLRLEKEGESFADYLEGFLGESLRGAVDECVEWDAGVFKRIDKPDSYQAIEGGHPEPSDRIAKLFHRLKVSMPTRRSKKRFALGDIYMSQAKDKVRVVLSPDCDLVPRPKEGPRAPRLLTLGGKLTDLRADGAFVGDLVMVGDEPKAIKWSLKDIATHPTKNPGELTVEGLPFALFGTLRPQQAQHIQAKAFADLRRVGLAVEPTVYRTVKVEAMQRSKSGKLNAVASEELAKHPATLFFAREGSNKGHHVHFHRSFVRALYASLEQVKSADLMPADKSQFQNFMENRTKVTVQMQRDGLIIGDKGPYGTSLAQEKTARDGGWLQFVVRMEDG